MANALVKFSGNVYERYTNGASHLQSLILLIIRVYIGYQCIIAGIGHLQNHPKMVDFFTSLHIPMPSASAYVSALTEIIGGALLGLGILSRATALVLAFNFVVAIISVRLSKFDFSYHQLGSAIWDDQSVVFRDTAFPYFATSLIVMIFGPGWFSVDGIFRRWKVGSAAERP